MKGSAKINYQLINHCPLLFWNGLFMQERFCARSLPVYLPGLGGSEEVVVFIVVVSVVVVVVEVVVVKLLVVFGLPPQQPEVNEYILVKSTVPQTASQLAIQPNRLKSINESLYSICD
jgi:hypothetical protein